MSTLEKIVRIKREKINLLKSSNNFTDHFITNNTKPVSYTHLTLPTI